MQRQWSSQRSTIHDVAARAGVSAATVSKVLRGVKTVKRENSERVHLAVAELKYRVDPLAAGLRHERRRIIACVVPDLENPFFGALVTSLQRAAEATNYDVIIASSRESETREAELIARMNDWRVAGTVLVPVRSERGEGASALRAGGNIAVLLDRVSADDRFDSVAADNLKASAQVAKLLVENGHRHVLLHGATEISKAVRTRVEGFTQHAKKLNPEMQIDLLLSDDDSEAQRLSVQEYFDAHKTNNGASGDSGKSRPTAVFALSQHSTLLVMAEIRRRGILCPEEISLVGFDDVEWMETTWPSISAVVQPVHAIAERAMSVLLARIEGENGGPVQYLEPCELRVRESLGPAKRRRNIRQEAETTKMPRR